MVSESLLDQAECFHISHCLERSHTAYFLCVAIICLSKGVTDEP